MPLAKSLVKKGYNVKGSVTSAEKMNTIDDPEIDVSVVKTEANTISISNPDFFKTDVLFINIPPQRIPDIEAVYPAQIGQILPFIAKNKIEKVIFVSSTSVYPEINGEVTEEDDFQPEKGSGMACLNAEQLLQKQADFATTIIRFGGLIGADRNPHRFMKRGIKNGPGLKPINLIHLDDCIGIVHHILKVANAEPPEFDASNDSSFKIVSSEKLINKLGYSFKYESPMDWL